MGKKNNGMSVYNTISKHIISKSVFTTFFYYYFSNQFFLLVCHSANCGLKTE